MQNSFSLTAKNSIGIKTKLYTNKIIFKVKMGKYNKKRKHDSMGKNIILDENTTKLQIL